MENQKAVRPFGMRDKLSYMMGDVGCNMSFALNSYIQTFFLLYIGLDPLIIAAVILILKIWDGINDPIMGAIMDTVKPGKNGKFKTWIFYGSFLLLFSGALCFIDTKNAAVWVQVVIFVLGYFIWDFSYTLVNVPYGSLNSAITADSTERSQLSTWRSIGSILANMVVMVLLPMLIYTNITDENGEVVQVMLGERMFWIALIMGVLGFIAFQILNKFTVERVKVEHKEKEGEEKKVNYFKALGAFFKNRPAVAVTLAAMLSLIMLNGMTTATAVLYTSYFKSAELGGIVSIIGMVPMFLCIPLIKPLVSRFGNKAICAWSLPIGIVGAVLIVILPLPQNFTGLILFGVLNALVGLGYAAFTLVGWAMVADCIDYQELKTGVRTEGIVYATYSLGRKLAQGFGASLILVLLYLIGYDSTLPNPAAQSLAVAENTKVLIGAVYLVCMILMFVVLEVMYNIDKKTAEQISTKLGHNNQALVGHEGDEA